MLRAPRRSAHSALIACLCLAGVGACDSGAPTEPLPTPPATTSAVKVGDLIPVNVNGNETCTNPTMRATRVVAIGARSLVLADTLNPSGGFTTADYQRFAARFDTLVYPVATANFGEPTDIDENSRVVIVFTRAVNELTTAGSGQYVGGFAYSRDLFPRADKGRAQGCLGSNMGEYFYALAPDPSGQVNGNVFSTAFVDSSTTVVLIHELEHIINASRRLYVTEAPVFESTWLDEGLAHIAEELLFHRLSGLSPRTNIDAAALQATDTRRAAFNAAMQGNAGRYRGTLLGRGLVSPYKSDDALATRGATWSLLRYAADRQRGTSRATGGAPGGTTASPALIHVGSGDIVLPAAPLGGAEYLVTVTNPSLLATDAASYSIRASGSASSSISPDALMGPTLLQASLQDAPVGRRIYDDTFEHRLRARERGMGAQIAGARAWHAARRHTREASVGSAAARPQFSMTGLGAADVDAAFWTRLVNTRDTGTTNLQAVLGAGVSAAEYVRDWNVSHVVDDIAAIDPVFQQPSWNWHTIYPALTGSSGGYPLPISSLTASPLAGTAVGGGAAYYRVTLAAGATGAISLSTSNTMLNTVVVRTK